MELVAAEGQDEGDVDFWSLIFHLLSSRVT